MSTQDCVIFLILLLVGASWAGSLIFSIIEKSRTKRIVDFLNENAQGLLAGQMLEFEGQMYHSGSELIQYQWCTSILLMTFTRATSLRLREDAAHAAVFSFVLTLFGGWWGIPWGPIHSIECFAKNAGAKTVTLGELLCPVTPAPTYAT